MAKHRLVKFTEMFENKERKDFASDLFPTQIDVEGENIIDEQKPQHDESEHDSMEKQTNKGMGVSCHSLPSRMALGTR